MTKSLPWGGKEINVLVALQELFGLTYSLYCYLSTLSSGIQFVMQEKNLFSKLAQFIPRNLFLKSFRRWLLSYILCRICMRCYNCKFLSSFVKDQFQQGNHVKMDVYFESV